MLSVQAHQDIGDYIVGLQECDEIVKVEEKNIESASEEWDSALAFIEEEFESVCKVFKNT